MRKHLLSCLAFALLTVASSHADAFCGFYVSGASTDLYNDATMVSLMRDGQTTVMAMRNDYRGPPEDFAMVVPVPVVLEKKQVKTLEDGVFGRLRTQTAPRLVEYWQKDPCHEEEEAVARGIGELGGKGAKGVATGTKKGGGGHVTVEAEFKVGEYEIVVLSSDESNALERWLNERKYKIPKGAAKYFRPYVKQGSYFFVAKVDVDKVRFKDGRAKLSPLRFHYESEMFKLPIRLGLINSKGQQDLLVHILAKGQRYAVANRPNVAIPTNLPVDEATKKHFGAFYERLFSRVMEANPEAVVTEYAWEAGKCDPCPPRQISGDDFMTLGRDVVSGVGGGIDESQEKLVLRGGGGGSEDNSRVDREAVESNLREQLTKYDRRFLRCYERALRVRPGRGGKVAITGTLNADGEFSGVRPRADSVGGGVGGCVARMFEAIPFPKMDIDEPFTFTKVFVFRPSEVGGRLGGGRNPMKGWVVTRLHTRYSSDEIGKDLVFEKVPPLKGGNGMPEGKFGVMGPHGADGAVGSNDAQEDAGEEAEKDDVSKAFDIRRAGIGSTSQNRFQARYAILHRWSGDVGCEQPRWNRWGGRDPDGGGSNPVTADRSSAGAAGNADEMSLAEHLDWAGTDELGRKNLHERLPKLEVPDDVSAEHPSGSTGAKESDEEQKGDKTGGERGELDEQNGEKHRNASTPSTQRKPLASGLSCTCSTGRGTPPVSGGLMLLVGVLAVSRRRRNPTG